MRIALAAVFVLAAACSKKQQAAPVPTCAQVVDNMLAITKIAYPGHGDMQMGNTKQMVQECERRNLTDEQKRCMLAAKDMKDLGVCSKQGAPAAAPAAKP